MRLILIHGAPATGKLTVARALSALGGVPLVDNHAAIDIARMALDFGADGFWELVHDLRVTTLRGLARANVARLIVTSAYSHPADEPLVRDYEAAIGAYGGEIDPVYLSCSEGALMARVSSPERIQRGKIATPDGLRAYLAENDIAAIRHERCLHLSTESATPTETATTIARALGLPVLREPPVRHSPVRP